MSFRHSDRTLAKGKRLGRPKRHLVPVDHVKEQLAAGISLRQIARDLDIPVSTLHRQLKCSEKGVEPTPPTA